MSFLVEPFREHTKGCGPIRLGPGWALPPIICILLNYVICKTLSLPLLSLLP
jgi:hypothetical protein